MNYCIDEVAPDVVEVVKHLMVGLLVALAQESPPRHSPKFIAPRHNGETRTPALGDKMR